MKVIGIRNSPTKIRYCILEKNENEYIFSNSGLENRLLFPKGMDDIGEKLNWCYDEVSRIIRKNSDIDKIVIKTSELSMRGETNAIRMTTYLDGILILLGKQLGITIVLKKYTNLNTKRVEVKKYAEERVGKTLNYWDEQIADAIAAAFSEIN